MPYDNQELLTFVLEKSLKRKKLVILKFRLSKKKCSIKFFKFMIYG